MQVKFLKSYDAEVLGEDILRHIDKGTVLHGIVEWNPGFEDQDSIDIHLNNDEWLLYVPISVIDELPY